MKQIVYQTERKRKIRTVFGPASFMLVNFGGIAGFSEMHRACRWGWALLLLSIFCCPSSIAAVSSEVTILRKQAQMRKGPASYHAVIAVVPENTRLTPSESTMGWFKVAYDGKNGFISSKVTQPLAPKEDVFSQMATQVVNMKLSRHGMSAGAKGFANHFSKPINSDPALVEKIAAFQLDAAAHDAFTASTYKNASVDQFHSRIALPSDGTRSSYTVVEQGLGMSIAGKIGSLKLMEDPELTQYINHVGQLVAAASSGYDLPFAFFVIDDAKSVNAYACPGGYIFVTRGLLRHIKDEAELAAVLAHEVAHVTHQHGLQEIAQRKPMIVAENAFAELDEETASGEDGKWKAIEEDLDQFALSVYETIFEGRLARYELDADRIGLIYAARSGYDPEALVGMLKRLKQADTVSTNAHYTALQVDQRLQGIKLAMDGIPANQKYFRLAERWRLKTAVLRKE